VIPRGHEECYALNPAINITHPLISPSAIVWIVNLARVKSFLSGEVVSHVSGENESVVRIGTSFSRQEIQGLSSVIVAAVSICAG